MASPTIDTGHTGLFWGPGRTLMLAICGEAVTWANPADLLAWCVLACRGEWPEA